MKFLQIPTNSYTFLRQSLPSGFVGVLFREPDIPGAFPTEGF